MTKNKFLSSHPQKRIYYTELASNHLSTAHLKGSIFFNCTLNVELLNDALNDIIKTHESLRMNFFNESDHTYYKIKPFKYIKFEVKSIDDLSQLENLPDLKYRLEKDNLFTLIIIKYQHLLGYYFSFHHIIMDALSVSLFHHKVSLKITQDQNQMFKSNDINYEMFRQREIAYLRSENFYKDEMFFKSKFDKPLDLNMFKPISSNMTYQINRYTFSFTKEESLKLSSFFKTEHTTPFRFFMAVFVLYMFKYYQKDSVIITTGHHNRLNENEFDILGMTVSTVPIVFEVQWDQLIKSFLTYISQNITQYLEHQAFPFDLLAPHLRNLNINPMDLLQITLNQIPSKKEDHLLKRYKTDTDHSILDIKINPQQKTRDEPIDISIDYRLTYFNENALSYMEKRLKMLTHHIIDFPKSSIYEVFKQIDESAKENIDDSIQYVCNNEDHALHLFLDQVKKRPNHIALILDELNITYHMLDTLSTQMAHMLKSHGIEKHDYVGVMLPRTPMYAIAVLGILKVGATFIPFDLNEPMYRLEKMIQTISLKYMVCLNDYEKSFDLKYINISYEKIKEYPSDAVELEYDFNLDHLAYMIFTSGTLGIPKAVRIAHKQLASFLNWFNDCKLYDMHDVFSSYCAINFDVSLAELWIPLSIGATLVYIPEHIKLDISAIKNHLNHHQVTILTLPTKFGELFIKNEQNVHIKTLIVAGEKLNYFIKKPYEIINAYGPTEATIYTSYFKVTEPMPIYPIGKPSYHIKTYILDQNFYEVPVGVMGQLCLSGLQVSDDYHNASIQHEKAWIKHPFEKDIIIYQTGDYVYKDFDEQLVFVKRMDDQIKKHGYRIELSEIEHAFMVLPYVKLVYVDYEMDPSKEVRLYAYVQTESEILTSQIKADVSRLIPNYMMPDRIFLLKEMPLNTRGKIDQQKIKDMTHLKKEDCQTSTVMNSTETIIFNLWKKLLNHDSMSVNCPFSSVGGHSLLMVRLSYYLNQTFKKQIPVSILFEYQTIKQQAVLIKNMSEQPIFIVLKKNEHAKKSMICIHDMLGELLSYHQLAQSMNDDFNIYGVRAPKHIDTFHSVEALSTYYIKQIHENSIKTPITLVGYSSGGMLAYEVARQLINENYQIDALILLDAPNYHFQKNVMNSFYKSALRHVFRWFFQLPLKSKFHFFKIYVAQIVPSFFIKLWKHKTYEPLKLQKHLRKILLIYTPPKWIHLDIYAFWSQSSVKRQMHMGWDTHGHLKSYVLKGNHMTIISKQSVNYIIAQVPIIKGEYKNETF